jgi:hypothetical protein
LGLRDSNLEERKKLLSRIFHNFFLFIKYCGDDTEKDKARGAHCKLQSYNKHANTLVEKPTWMRGSENGRAPIKHFIKINLRNCVVNNIFTFKVSRLPERLLTLRIGFCSVGLNVYNYLVKQN